MITLVEDIIGLSRLDDGRVERAKEPVNLLELAKNNADILKESAAKKQVEISLEGTETVVKSNPRLISEIIYNLCDNAVKYNRTGGKVKISVKDEGSFGRITVSDNGIGIPPDAKERVFERFFCVDKSHSKEVGGTGLGLSIVKHAVKLLGGEISLESELDRGTTVSVTVPKE